MSKGAAEAAKPLESSVNMPFEEALKKLESIVEAMEGDDLPLETLLSKYEDGARLAQLCQSRLSEAEVKIQQLEKTANGQFALKNLPLSQESAA
jgi:exodeoxyribonuclease VII small subunit